MSRPAPQPRKVEALAAECRGLLVWLRGPGKSAGQAEFAVVHRAYCALLTSVAMLPRGPAALERARALPARRPEPRPTTTRSADSFTIDDVVLLDKRVLTPQGWVVPAPIVPHVDRERERLKAEQRPHTDADALREILRRATGSDIQAGRSLNRHKVRLTRSRQR